MDRGAVREMEVVWPSGAALRKEASNHHEGRWLKTVVLSVVEKARRGSRQVRTGKMSDERQFSAVDMSKFMLVDIKTKVARQPWEEPGGYPLTARVVSGIQAA
jgi:hypothetical protein